GEFSAHRQARIVGVHTPGETDSTIVRRDHVFDLDNPSLARAEPPKSAGLPTGRIEVGSHADRERDRSTVPDRNSKTVGLPGHYIDPIRAIRVRRGLGTSTLAGDRDLQPVIHLLAAVAPCVRYQCCAIFRQFRPAPQVAVLGVRKLSQDRKSTRLNSSHVSISYAVFCLKTKKQESENADT